jgi:hypothetical protein
MSLSHAIIVTARSSHEKERPTKPRAEGHHHEHPLQEIGASKSQPTSAPYDPAARLRSFNANTFLRLTEVTVQGAQCASRDSVGRASSDPSQYSPVRISNARDARPEIGDELLQYKEMWLEFRRQVATGLSRICGNLRRRSAKPAHLPRSKSHNRCTNLDRRRRNDGYFVDDAGW